MIEQITFKGKTYKLRDWVTISIFGLQVLAGTTAFVAFLFFALLFV